MAGKVLGSSYLTTGDLEDSLEVRPGRTFCLIVTRHDHGRAGRANMFHLQINQSLTNNHHSTKMSQKVAAN